MDPATIATLIAGLIDGIDELVTQLQARGMVTDEEMVALRRRRDLLASRFEDIPPFTPGGMGDTKLM